jgi:biopolymer transport protein ExbB
MYLLVLTSIVSLTFIIERGLALRRNKVVPAVVEGALERCQAREDLGTLQVICQQQPSALGRLVLTAIDHLPWPKEDNADCLQTLARHEVVSLERGLVVLEIAVGIAPLMGLVGTLHGMIVSFANLGKTGFADSSALAHGIAITLNTTLMGLLIAIPSLIAWSYFTRKVEAMMVEMETLLDDFLRRQYRRLGRPGAEAARPEER